MAPPSLTSASNPKQTRAGANDLSAQQKTQAELRRICDCIFGCHSRCKQPTSRADTLRSSFFPRTTLAAASPSTCKTTAGRDSRPGNRRTGSPPKRIPPPHDKSTPPRRVTTASLRIKPCPTAREEREILQLWEAAETHGRSSTTARRRSFRRSTRSGASPAAKGCDVGLR